MLILEGNQNKNKFIKRNFYDKLKSPALFFHLYRTEKSAGYFNLLSFSAKRLANKGIFEIASFSPQNSSILSCYNHFLIKIFEGKWICFATFRSNDNLMPTFSTSFISRIPTISCNSNTTKRSKDAFFKNQSNHFLSQSS